MPQNQRDNKKPLTIVLSGGGTGGHLAPLLPLARVLKIKDPNCRIVYIGENNAEPEGTVGKHREFDEVYTISSGKFRRYSNQNPLSQILDVKSQALNTRDFFRVLRGLRQATKLMKKIRPDVVFSKGGYVAVPVGLAAKRLKIPIVTHDSDAISGLANRMISKGKAVHTTGFPKGAYSYESIEYVGIPLDDKIRPVDVEQCKDFKSELGLADNSQVLLIVGGTLGAKVINGLVAQIAGELLKNNPRLQVVHITGPKNEEEVEKAYRQKLAGDMLQRVKLLGFTSEFYKYTGAADLVVSRAGATTLAELAVQGKPVVIIPSPYLSGGHQLKNAEVLKKLGAAEVLPNDVDPKEFLATVEELLNSTQKRTALSKKIAALGKRGGADRLAEIILESARGGKSGES